jgi:2-polyprenyl-3-methyl-5-hydroxy-6-metoxy-1,4-benzoquinol methylase
MKSKATGYAKKAYQPGKLSYQSKADKVRFKKIIDFVGANKKVLDVGCYDGSLGKELIKKGNQVYGIEINKKAAQLAEKRGLKIKIQDFTKRFDYQANFFDVIVASEVIEHVLDTDFFIKEIKRVLRPNGYLILTTPNAASLGRRIYLLLGKNPYFEASFGFPKNADAGHIRFFVKDLLLDYLRHHDFEVDCFTSDVINFNQSGSLASKCFANFFPSLGRSLIVKARIK